MAVLVPAIHSLGGNKFALRDEADLLLLHETAMRFLIAKPGRYRDFDFHIVDEGAVVFRDLAANGRTATAAGPARTPDLGPLKDYLDGLLAERFAGSANRRGKRCPKRSLQKKA